MERCAATNQTVTTVIDSFPCLDATGKLPLPLNFGDPPFRQVPLFVAWEAYHEHFVTRRHRGQHKAPSSAAGTMKDVTFIQIGANCGKNTYGCAIGALKECASGRVRLHTTRTLDPLTWPNIVRVSLRWRSDLVLRDALRLARIGH
jgi:hypothetical protein